MAELLKHYLFYTFHSLTKYDYMALGWVLFLAFLLMFLGAFVRRRGLSYFLLLLGMVLLFFGPPAVKVGLDRYIRKADVSLKESRFLRYSDALLLEGNLTNAGKVDYSSCDLVIVLYRPRDFLGDWSPWLKPSVVRIKTLETPLEKGETKPFRILVDHLPKRNDLNTTVTARCYP
ncbi:MAG: DUF2393 domain-containing protein [Epsilonproteobacteria bacterium]|nr:DUF2393 domain-containing protein [Campylobacterota bacterium]